jgi:hypothetical protein
MTSDAIHGFQGTRMSEYGDVTGIHLPIGLQSALADEPWKDTEIKKKKNFLSLFCFSFQGYPWCNG